MASIRERNGKFNVIYSYTNEKGERKQKWETYETKAEAKRRKKEIEYKKEMGLFVVRKCKTLDELITEYVALYGKENWALSTYEGNVSLINNYILPIIGDTKLSEINTRFIICFIIICEIRWVNSSIYMFFQVFWHGIMVLIKNLLCLLERAVKSYEAII